MKATAFSTLTTAQFLFMIIVFVDEKSKVSSLLSKSSPKGLYTIGSKPCCPLNILLVYNSTHCGKIVISENVSSKKTEFHSSWILRKSEKFGKIEMFVHKRHLGKMFCRSVLSAFNLPKIAPFATTEPSRTKLYNQSFFVGQFSLRVFFMIAVPLWRNPSVSHLLAR